MRNYNIFLKVLEKVLPGPSAFHPDDVLYQCITRTAVIGVLIDYALMADIFIALLL